MDDKERRKIKRIIIESLRNGATKTKACAEANINRDTFYRWMKIAKSFKREVEEAVESQIGVVEDALYKIAAEGNLPAQKFFLCNRASDKWKETTKHEIGGSLELTYANLVKAKKEREKNKR
ncbi:hypothetical protein ES705_32004 [subsurface metagenome]